MEEGERLRFGTPRSVLVLDDSAFCTLRSAFPLAAERQRAKVLGNRTERRDRQKH